MKRVKVLGAGPSGLTAAVNLVKAGYRVEVFEKKRSVGQRFNGDLQGLENWSDKEDVRRMLKNMNLNINFDFSPFSELTISNVSREVSFSFEKPAFYLVRRGPVSGSLDKGLLEQSLDSGVDIHFDESIPEEDADIVATGPNPKKTPAIVRGICFYTNIDDIAIIIFNNDTAYKGYSYLLVSDGYGCMCTVTFEKFERVDRCFKETKKAFFHMVNLDVENCRKIAGIGSFSVNGVFEKDGRLYVGEAAGLQDFLWGFGIKRALTSGYLAAKSLIEEKDYREIARDYFKNKLKASLVNRFLWESLGTKDYSLILDVLENTSNPLNFLFSFHNFNLLQRSLYPLALQYVKRKNRNLEL